MIKGQIIKALSGFYYVKSEGHEQIYQCRARGNFRKKGITPYVGDHVTFQIENETDGYILEILERQNVMVRPPVANVDRVIIVMSSVEPAFSLNLVDKFITIVESYDIEPVLLVTKKDLLSSTEIIEIEQHLSYYHKIGYDVMFVSNKDEHHFKDLIKGITVLAGQSGVGKSSFINALIPEAQLNTGVISNALNRGKHTTRHVELLPLENGYIADTPGFSSLDLDNVDKQTLKYCFVEFVECADACKFRECLHLNEPKCAVKTAVESGEISATRYLHYQQMLQEIESRKVRY
ncbi:ribosome small subunit-dependent GTPase A [Macrococcoides caseolyticum]|uniref:ribosome small subunit-dependent GTPase A n=1 Tax=Macrococcoides caseolyticum TaxID=69966 RepID=UPI001F1955C3|nr:ribosome small subunit-dependent GTPase A [Macrococcus caseolyticus]MCE4956790.1 ribosome small subunit-dependent GTPase A [Macrococcus caseolyticus]